jgi:hypothetical protein
MVAFSLNFFVKTTIFENFLKKKIHKNAQNYHYIMTLSHFLQQCSTFWSFFYFLKITPKKTQCIFPPIFFRCEKKNLHYTEFFKQHRNVFFENFEM